jgi:hypothetical protein
METTTFLSQPLSADFHSLTQPTYQSPQHYNTTLHSSIPCLYPPKTMVPPPPNTPSQPTFFNTVLNQSNTINAPSSTSPRAPRQPHQQSSTFSATQRDQQARNKPYGTVVGGAGADSYEDRQRRDEARSILESVEMLIWYSAARNEVRLLHSLSLQSDYSVSPPLLRFSMTSASLADLYSWSRVSHKPARTSKISASACQRRER